MNIKDLRIGQGVSVETVGVISKVDNSITDYPQVNVTTNKGVIIVRPEHLKPVERS